MHDDCALGRGPADGDAAAAAEVEQALVAELPQRSQDGVAVDLEDRREVTRRRAAALPGLRLALGDRTPDLGGDLLVEPGRFLAVDLDLEQWCYS